MKNYYKFLDKKIGELIELINNDTTIFIVSDHGAKAMKGCLCVNMVLEKLGLLKFLEKPKRGTRLEETKVDWKNTYAWGWGGYYARIFLNVKGREENGLIEQEDYEIWREKVIDLLKDIPDVNGKPMQTKVFKPEDLFEKINGDAPDLMVYFDDLNWRSAGTLGYDSMYLDENDTGPDDAVHDYNGIFIISKPNQIIGKNIGIKSIVDIVPTIMDTFGMKIPSDMSGNIIKYE